MASIARRTAGRLGALALVVLGAGTAGAAAPGDDDAIRLGVRRDAAPFSYWNEEAARYEGFLVDLCRTIVEQMGRPWETVEVAARARFAEQAGYDVLCDPATVTLERARLGVFSPPIFVSGISFVFSARNDTALYEQWLEQQAEAGEGATEQETADAAVPACTAADREGRRVQARLGTLAATTATAFVTRALIEGDERLPDVAAGACLHEVEDHDEGFDALCGDELSYYFGDRDILSAHLARRRATGEDCALSLSRRYLTVEPYALFVRARDSDFISAFMAAFYAAFGDDGAVPRALFERYFSDRRPSELVETIFFLNAAGAQ